VEAVTEPRQPPNDVQAEQGVLGAMMLNRDVLLECSELLTPESFYLPKHGTIFTAIVDLDAKGDPADAFTVAMALGAGLDRIGGGSYLHDLISTVPTAVNGPYYARAVKAKETMREVQKIATRLGQLASGGTDPAVALEQAMQSLLDLESTSAPGKGGPKMWAEIAPRVLDEIEQDSLIGDDDVPGIPTGLLDLDQLLNGLHAGQLIVVGARPGVGKSLLLAGIAQHAAWKKKLTSAFFSLEMTSSELGKRLISSDSRVPLHAIMSGKVDVDDWVRIHNTVAESLDAPLAIDDTPELTIGDIRSRARKIHRQHGGLALVAVDYLQLINGPRGENRQVAVGQISRGLKLMAKQLNVPVIVAAQLNRDSEKRTDKRPMMSDFRESGGIENDADVIILIHRDDYHDPESSRAGEADLIVDKNRNGAKDTITVAAQLHLARFQSMAIV
jgi:replicative DNA helicase